MRRRHEKREAAFLPWIGVALFAIALGFAGCNGLTGIAQDEEPIVVDEIPLSIKKMVLFTDLDGLPVSAEMPENLKDIATLQWESDNEEIAKVEESGDTVTISPVAAGSAFVSVTIVPNEGFKLEGELNAKCEVIVVENFALAPENLVLFAGETSSNAALELPSAVFEVVDVEWTTPGAQFTMNADGKTAQITPPASLSGTATGALIATLRNKTDFEGAFNGDGKAASIQVTAYPALSLTIDPLGSVELAESPLNGQVTKSLTAHFTPSALTSLSPAPVLDWSSDNEAVATVTGGVFPSATLTAKAAGSANIQARLLSSGREVAAIIPVTVTNWVDKTVPVTAVSIASKPTQLAVGDDTGEFTVTVTPSNATYKTISWEFNGAATNSALQLITVNASQGKYKLKGAAAGSNIVVKAKAHNGVADQFTLSVTALGVAVTKTAGNNAMTKKSPAETAKLKADLTPAFASNKKILWTSSVPAALALSASNTTSGGEVTVTANLVSTATTVTVTAKSEQDQNKSATYQFTINPPVYKVKYDKNGGAGTDMAQSSHTYGTASALTANAYTKTGHTFKAWNTKADGTGSSLTQAASLATVQDELVTVYAIWEPIKYNITYYPNGGTGTNTVVTANYGTTHTVKAGNLFTAPSGKVFNEWNRASAGTGTASIGGAALTVEGDVSLYAQWVSLGEIPNGKQNSADLMVKFGIKEPGYENNYNAADVTNTFLAVKAYINKAGVSASGSAQSMKLGNIALGDYVDLRSFQVAPDEGGTDENAGKAAFTSNLDAEYDGVNYGKLLRIMVVGINAYNGKNGNGTANHLVFQFQNSPARHRINASGAPVTDGYLNSKMRAYVKGNFLTGLLAAGVPDSVLWAPARKVAANGGLQTISDKLWIPTFWEVSGDNKAYSGNYVLVAPETADNQAWYSYYPIGAGPAPERIKHWLGGSSSWSWWTASSYTSGNKPHFPLTYHNGILGTESIQAATGVAPAFCVR